LRVFARAFDRLTRLLFATALLAFGAGGGVGCAHPNFFPGTTILRTAENQRIIDTIDLYRQRLIERNVDGLLVLASERYREDSGTPRSDDDYGYEGLKEVLHKRLTRLKSIWYEIELRDIYVQGNEAQVDVFLNGSFELASEEMGDRYHRVNDYHRFVLERQDDPEKPGDKPGSKHGDKWKFLSGM
jgi:hypothetical protein